MKLELRKNMYVRNCYGRIAKIEYIEDNTAYCDNWLYQSYEDHITFINLDDEDDIDEILKTSYNIIEILEENDYVNGLRVEKNKYGELYTSYVYYGGDIGKQCEVYTSWLKELEEDMIYSVVTKEQFESMSYKLGD